MQNNDPLASGKFRPPGLLERFSQALLGAARPLACAQIEITSHCLGKCVYCPHTSPAWRPRHMGADTFARLWPILRRAARAHLQGWGEPLLHPRFFDLVEFAARAGCLVSTTSCGLIMSPEIADKIAASGMDAIGFSLAGTDGLSNAARQGVDFEQVCRNIGQLKAAIKKNGAGPEIHLAYLLLADRPEACAALPKLMEKLDVSTAVVSTLDYLARQDQRHLAYSPADTAKLARAADILARAAAEAGKGGRLIYYELPDASARPPGGCRENAAANIYVAADGSISPCVYLNVPNDSERGLTFGNALADNPWEVWQDSNFRRFRNDLCARNIPAACADCPKHSMSGSA